jgi:hypothetical protein
VENMPSRLMAWVMKTRFYKDLLFNASPGNGIPKALKNTPW